MAQSIMIQGTCSNAGKSLITAGLCRVFYEDGYSVAPFKAQNMSLNSYVTVDKKEMGRAQVTQAMACRVAPDVRMNPVLIKPNSDTGSQIIVMGEPIGNMNAFNYYGYKERIKPVIKEAYEHLANKYDIVVIEGAGSPAEINLKENDIVNMYMAKMANAAVIIVGDIDRGGVFAHIIGTLELFDEAERNMTAGFIINKFRGDISLLTSGLEFLEHRTNKKVFGVVPMIANLNLPDEDSVEFKNMINTSCFSPDKDINIALIDLPHISNFTDFDTFRNHDDVNIYVVNSIEKIGNPDVIILPGSKNVIEDIKYLELKGFIAELMKLHKAGKTIVGICGGYQMLGKTIADPHGVESSIKSIKGLGFLNIETCMDETKMLSQVAARCCMNDLKINGYEIHHGKTSSLEKPYFVSNANDILGCIDKTGKVWGTYIHGVFDNIEFMNEFLNKIRKEKGLVTKIQDDFSLEKEFSRLAAVIRQNIDMPSIYKLMNLTEK